MPACKEKEFTGLRARSVSELFGQCLPETSYSDSLWHTTRMPDFWVGPRRQGAVP